jgi:hypothetical protein
MVTDETTEQPVSDDTDDEAVAVDLEFWGEGDALADDEALGLVREPE